MDGDELARGLHKFLQQDNLPMVGLDRGNPQGTSERDPFRSTEEEMAVTDRIEINPKVMLGKPVIRGTRITVELILRKLSEGASEPDLLDAYPRLSREDLQAAMAYAADVLAHEETVLLEQAESS